LVTIDTVFLKDFGTDQTLTISPPITNYNGSPLYCHANQDAANNVTLLIDEKPPSSFAPLMGPITTVVVEYTVYGHTPLKQQWDVTGKGMTYVPSRWIEYKLVFTPPAGTPPPPAPQPTDLSRATLQISELKTAHDPRNGLGIIVLGPQITGGLPQGYFVQIPMAIDPKGLVDPTEFAAMGISWSPDMSIAGPIGGGTIP
jgi:hypothetical protein